MAKDRVKTPDDMSELQGARRDRMACYMALRNKDFDYVNKMLSTDLDKRTIFNLLTIVETVHPAKEYVEKWKFAFDTLIERLVAEDYNELLINHVKKTLN